MSPSTDLLRVSHAGNAPAAPPPVPRSSAWIPVRGLSERHRSRILVHLLALDERDRYLRFGYPASDSQIERYAQSLDFEHDEVFGVFNRRLELIAMAHLAMQREVSAPDAAAWAEFGVSVAHKARGRGFGRRLFDHAVLHARNRGIDTLLIHALSENAAMLKIARSAGAVVERDGPESQARLKLPPDNLATHVDQVVEQQVAEIDYQMKRQAKRLDDFLSALMEVKANINKSSSTASE
jgi:GNAT superfamily N-acetyltransferase